MFNSGGENHDVIEIQKQGLAPLVTENPLHNLWEVLGVHEIPFKKSERDAEHSFESICLSNWGWVYDGEPVGPCQHIKGLLDAWKRKRILSGLVVMSVASAHAKAAIFLFDQYNGGYNESCCFFDYLWFE